MSISFVFSGMPHSVQKHFFITCEFKLCTQLFIIQANFCFLDERVFTLQITQTYYKFPPISMGCMLGRDGSEEITVRSSRWHPTPQKLPWLCKSVINTDYQVCVLCLLLQYGIWLKAERLVNFLKVIN